MHNDLYNMMYFEKVNIKNYFSQNNFYAYYLKMMSYSVIKYLF